MSFALTTPQMLACTKTVTRRKGWRDLQPGTLLQAIEKGQGLKKGEKVVKLGVIRVVDVRREPLFAIIREPFGADREGFPELTAMQFMHRFCGGARCSKTDEITRIEFEHVDELQPPASAFVGFSGDNKTLEMCEARGDDTAARGLPTVLPSKPWPRCNCDAYGGFPKGAKP